jgi:tRNA threonylcarbamoyladenosine biosynthesis protein TsaB
MQDPLKPPARTLVIATGHALSLALLEADRLLAEDHRAMARGHAEALMPALRALLANRPPPTQILVETGPGSFTGLRVGIAAARALALAWRVPVAGVTAMQLVAAEAVARGHRGPLLVALAAPRGQTWVQRMAGFEAARREAARGEAARREAAGGEAAGGQPLDAPAALPPDLAQALLAATRDPLTGSGAAAHPGAGPEREPRARFALAIPPDQRSPPLPLYIRPEAQAA